MRCLWTAAPSAAPAGSSFTFLPNPDDLEDWGDEDEPDVLRLPRWSPPARKPSAYGQKASDVKNPQAWKRQLNQLTQRMRDHPAPAPQPLSWPPGRRVVYIVDKPTTMEGRGLMVMGDWEKVPSRERAVELRIMKPGDLSLVKPGQFHALVNLLDENLLLFMFGGYD